MVCPRMKTLPGLPRRSRTPGLRYRNFGNEPVRPEVPPRPRMRGKGCGNEFGVRCGPRARLRRPDPGRGAAPHHEADRRGPLARRASGRRTLPAAAMPAWPLLESADAAARSGRRRPAARWCSSSAASGAGRRRLARCPPRRPRRLCAARRAPRSAAPGSGTFSRGLGAAGPGQAEPAGSVRAGSRGPRDHAAGGGAADPRSRRPAANPAFAGLRLPGHGPR